MSKTSTSIFKNHKDVGFKNKFNHFEYEKFPIIGVGRDKLPIVSMDKYINNSNNMEVFFEICKSLAILSSDRKMGMISGTLHPSEREKGHINFTEMLNNMDYYDPTGIHSENIKDLESKTEDSRSIYTYMYFAMGAHIPWYFNYYVLYNSFRTKIYKLNDYNDINKKHFPKLIQFVENLPMKVGRLVIFTTYPGVAVPTHRDSHVVEHTDHNINLFFNKWRPTFVYDDINNKKIYLTEGSTSYTFNNRYYHGVDSESSFRFTVRVDGQFDEKIINELKLR